MPAFDSGWTQVFKFHAILYTMIIPMTCLSLIGSCIPQASQASMFCVNWSMCLLVVAMIVTGIRRFNVDGEYCATSTAISEPDTGATFADNATALRTLFIAQCIMYIPTLCCFNFAHIYTFFGVVSESSIISEEFQRNLEKSVSVQQPLPAPSPDEK